MPNRHRHQEPIDLDEGLPPGPGGPQPLDWALFVLRAAWRRRLLVIGILVAGFAALGLYYRLKTPLYRVEARILAQRQQTLPSLVRVPGQEEAPTRTAHELIHRRDNLLALIREAELLGPQASRVPVAPPHPGAPEEDPVENLVILLDKRIQVATTEGTISISIDWHDPQAAYRLVDSALQNFLEARHVQEVTAIDETISVLRGRAAALREELDRVVEEARRQTRRQPDREALPAAPAVPPALSEDLARLRSMVEAKERAVNDVEEFRRRRLAELQTQLDAQRAVYSDAHPTVMGLRQDIAALSRESPQVAALREEERRLRLEYQSRLSKENRAAALPSAHPRPLPAAGAVEDNERVRAVRMEYQQMIDRVGAAQLDLDSARTTFKYRYEVMWPAQVPKKPFSPKPTKIFGLGGIACLLLALAAAGALERLRGRVHERWQVEKALELPIIAELKHK